MKRNERNVEREKCYERKIFGVNHFPLQKISMCLSPYTVSCIGGRFSLAAHVYMCIDNGNMRWYACCSHVLSIRMSKNRMCVKSFFPFFFLSALYNCFFFFFFFFFFSHPHFCVCVVFFRIVCGSEIYVKWKKSTMMISGTLSHRNFCTIETSVSLYLLERVYLFCHFNWIKNN